MYSNAVVCCEKDVTLGIPAIGAHIYISADTFTRGRLGDIENPARFVSDSAEAWLPKAHVEIERLRLVDA